MASFNHFLLAVFVFLVFAGFGVSAEESIVDVDGGLWSEGADSALLEDFNSKIQSLEHQVREKIREITEKDTVIAAKEKLIKEKLDGIVLLEAEIPSLQKMRDLNAVEEMGKAQARASESEKKIEEFKRDINFNIKEKEALKLRLTGAERKASELNSKLNSLQKIIDGQKIELHKTEHALRLAEEELTMVKLEATSKDIELLQVHNAWLPPWLAAHLIHFQTLLEKNWEIHGKPMMELLRQKAIEREAHFKKWAHRVEMVKTELVPAIKEQWVAIDSNMESHAQRITKKTIELYETSKKTVTPHIITVLEVVGRYFQQLTEVSKPYIDQVTTATKPHVDALHAALKPYKQQAIHICGKFLESATIYHNHVQHRVEEKLKSHESTKPLATKEIIWITASAVLATPVIFLLNVCSVVIGKNTRKPTKHNNTLNSCQKTEHRPSPSKVLKERNARLSTWEIVREVDQTSCITPTPRDYEPLCESRKVIWNAEQCQDFILNVDGSSLGNRGQAGFGAVIRDALGQWIIGANGNIGISDNLEAELVALLQGLKLAKDHGIEDLAIYSDSMEAIRLVKAPPNQHRFDPVIHKIRDGLNSLRKHELFHTFREGNSVADSLAKAGAKDVASFTTWTFPPDDVLPLLAKDASRHAYVRSRDGKAENRTINTLVDFYQEIVFTTVTSNPDIASQWIFDLYASHRNLHLMVGLDIEWCPPHTNPVATLQLCVANRCLILQLVHCRDLPRVVKDFLASPDNIFVGIEIKSDLKKLQEDYGFGLNANAKDLREEVVMAYERPELREAGLKTLTEVVLGKEVEKPKSVTVSKWDNFRLTKLQIKYACIDAFVCYEIGRSLTEHGHNRGLMHIFSNL